MAKLRNRLDELIKKWEQENPGMRMTNAALERATGVHRDAIRRLRKNEVSMYDESAVTELCKYFKVRVGDFLYIEPEPDYLAD